MNVADFILNGGTKKIHNPNYTSTNGQEKEIVVPDVGPETNPLINVARHDLENQYSIESSKAEKYRDYGLNWNPNEDMDILLANEQSNFKKVFNSLAQTIVSEIGAGTIKGFSDLITGAPHAGAMFVDELLSRAFDIKGNPVQNAFGMQDNDYSNPLSRKLGEFQEYFKNEVAPIYRDERLNIENGGLSDAGWWLSNVPQIASTLTLLIPARTATAGISKVGSFASKAIRAKKVEKLLNKAKATNEINEINRVNKTLEDVSRWRKFINDPTRIEKGKQLARIGSDAIIMRTIENYQEANQTYGDMYKESLTKLSDMSDEDYNKFIERNKKDLDANNIDANDKDAVAKYIAKSAADRTFFMDYANIVFDVVQLYGLRDIGKLSKATMSSSIKAGQRKSLKDIKALTKGADAVKESAAKEILKKAYDWTTGGLKTALSESTEGIEEAVNYIAQQEGLTYGRSILDGETDATLGKFWNTRLNDYLGSAELKESAFWGVLGGFVFAGGGNILNKVRINKMQKNLNKRNEEFKKATGVDLNIQDWADLGNMPEVIAAKTAINKRLTMFNQLVSDLNTLNNKRNPLVRDENGANVELEGDIDSQTESIKQQLVDNYTTQLALDAMNTGTFDLLVDYVRADEVKQAFVDKGIVSKEDADSFVNKTVDTLFKAEKLYSAELSHVNAQVSALNATRTKEEDLIPLEYVQQIAKANIDRKLRVLRYDEQLAKLNTKANNELNNIIRTSPEFSGLANDGKRLIRVQLLKQYFGELEADKNAVKEDKNLSEWRRQQSLADIQRQQDGIMKEIQDSIDEESITLTVDNEDFKVGNEHKKYAETLHTLQLAKMYVKRNNQYERDASKYEYNDEKIISEYEHYFKDNKTKTNVLSQLSKLIDKRFREVYNGKDGLFDKSASLTQLYIESASLELKRNMENRMVAATQSQIATAVDVLHNQYNETRKEVIATAEKTIRELYGKYLNTNADLIEKIVTESFYKSKAEAAELARKELIGTDEEGHSDAEKLIDALYILNFSSAANRKAHEYIMNVLTEYKERYNKERLKTSTSQNSNSAPQNSNLNNVSTNVQNTANEPKSSQIEHVSQTQTIQPTPQTNQANNREEREVNVLINNKSGKVVGINESNYKVRNSTASKLKGYKTDDGVELAINELKPNEQSQYIDSELFEIDESKRLNPNVEIRVDKNPVVIPAEKGSKFSIKEKGTIKYFNKSTGEEIGVGDEVSSEPQQQLSSTGVEEQTNSESAETPSPKTETNAQTESNVEPEKVHGLNEEQANWVDSMLSNHIDYKTKMDFDKVKKDTLEDITKVSLEVVENPEIYNAIENYIDSKLKDIEKVISRLQINTKLDEAAANLQIAATDTMYSKFEEPGEIKFSELFERAIETFIDEYTKHSLVDQVKGKKCIRVRDILKVCNDLNSTSDVTIAKQMYHKVVAYLKSPKGKSRYIVLDEQDIAEGKVIDKIKNGSSDKELDKVLENRLNPTDLVTELNNAMNEGDTERIKAIQDTVNSLKPGDSLDVEVTDKAILFTKNGITVGSISKPKLSGNGYYQYNDDWKSDVRLDNGKVVSKLKDIFKNIFTSNDKAAKELRSLFVEHYVNTRKGKYDVSNEILTKFIDNDIIKSLVSQSIEEFNNQTGNNIIFIEKQDDNIRINYDKLFNHLSKLWNYTYDNVNSTDESVILKYVDSSLNKWFDKLYKTYDSLYGWTPDKTITISYISEGNPNRIMNSDENPIDNYDKLEDIRTAIDDNHTAKVAIAFDNRILVSDSTASLNVDTRGEQDFTKGSTLVVIPIKQREPELTKAIGRLCTDDYFNTDPFGAKLQQAIKSRLYDLLIGASTGNINAIKELEHFITSLISVDPTTMSLFRPLANRTRVKIDKDFSYTKTAKEGFIIQLQNGPIVNVLSILYKNDYGYTLGYNNFSGNKDVFADTRKNSNNVASVATDIVNNFWNVLVQNFNINIDKAGIQADNGGDVSGFFNRNRDGKLQLQIGDYLNEVYDDYNDFICKNGLIKVNIRKNQYGSNFNNLGNTNVTDLKSNFVIKVNVPYAEGTPVEENNETTQVASQDNYVTTSDNKTYKVRNDGMYVDSTSDEEVFNKIHSTLLIGDVSGFYDTLLENVLTNEEKEVLTTLYTDDFGFYDVFPSNVVYKEKLSYLKEEKTNNGTVLEQKGGIASVPATFGSNGKVNVSNWFLNIASSLDPNKRKLAITKLMHEQLHLKFREMDADAKQKLFNDIDPIFNIVLNKVKEDRRKNKNDAITNHLYSLLTAYKKNAKLEEFIVEGITNKVLQDYMNNIEYEVTTEKKENIFTKFIDLILKFFGWNSPRDGKLFKEFYNILSNATYIEPSQAEEVSNEEEIKQEPEVKAESNTPSNSVLGSAIISNDEEDDDNLAAFEEPTDNVDTTNNGEDNIKYSAFEEPTDVNIKFPSINSLKNKIPLEFRENFNKLVKNGYLSEIC